GGEPESDDPTAHGGRGGPRHAHRPLRRGRQRGWLGGPGVAGRKGEAHGGSNPRTAGGDVARPTEHTPPERGPAAPGRGRGTFGVEALLDELAAKLDIDPLELRRRNHIEVDQTDDRPFSGKNLLECYRRAEAHWDRRHDVRARSTDVVKRGVGLASQIWYGGGGPPPYPWGRGGSGGPATVGPPP